MTRNADGYGLRSCVNSFIGYVNDKRVRLSVPEKEDFERALQMHLLGLPVFKRPSVAVVTAYWTNEGGIQARYGATKRICVQAAAAAALQRMYPEHVVLRQGMVRG